MTPSASATSGVGACQKPNDASGSGRPRRWYGGAPSTTTASSARSCGAGPLRWGEAACRPPRAEPAAGETKRGSTWQHAEGGEQKQHLKRVLPRWTLGAADVLAGAPECGATQHAPIERAGCPQRSVSMNDSGASTSTCSAETSIAFLCRCRASSDRRPLRHSPHSTLRVADSGTAKPLTTNTTCWQALRTLLEVRRSLSHA